MKLKANAIRFSTLPNMPRTWLIYTKNGAILKGRSVFQLIMMFRYQHSIQKGAYLHTIKQLSAECIDKVKVPF